MTPPQSGGFVPVELPEINEGPHFWYAVQWFMFTGIGVAGIVVFIRADLRPARDGGRTASVRITIPVARHRGSDRHARMRNDPVHD